MKYMYSVQLSEHYPNELRGLARSEHITVSQTDPQELWYVVESDIEIDVILSRLFVLTWHKEVAK